MTLRIRSLQLPARIAPWHAGLLLAALLGTSACSALPGEAEAKILNSSGDQVGTAEFKQTGQNTELHFTVQYLTPGPHAVHIHQGGSCNPPDFSETEGHFNPNDAMHGFEAQGGPHLGDLRNFEVSANGTAEVSRTLTGLTLGDEANSIMGRTIVIHAGPDDYVSQPSGASGEKVACGVIGPGSAN